MCRFFYQGLLAVSIALSLNYAIQASELVSTKTSLAQTDALSVSVEFDTPIQGDLYLATILPTTNTFLFIGAGMQLSTNAIPYQENGSFSGSLDLFSIPVTGLSEGDYPLFELVVTAGSSPYDVTNWVEGATGLHTLTFTVLPASSGTDDTTTTTTDDIAAGKSLYNEYCSDCHGSSYAHATSATETRHAINIDDGGMGYLSFLTDAELTSIANYMISVVGTSSTRPTR